MEVHLVSSQPSSWGWTGKLHIFNNSVVSCHTVHPVTQYIQPHSISSHTVHPATQYIQPHSTSCHTVHPTTQYIQPHSTSCHTVHPVTQYIQSHSTSSHTVHPAILTQQYRSAKTDGITEHSCSSYDSPDLYPQTAGFGTHPRHQISR